MEYVYVLTLTESFSSQCCESPSLSPLDHYVAYLKDVYKHEQFPVYNKWPHIEGKKFINLSLLSKHRITPQEAHQYTEAMFHGRISSINPDKKMEMEDIAKTDDGSILKGRRRCILVEGAPGVGKSTFAWKLCEKWGNGKILQQYRVMLLLRLREKRVREIRKDRDMFRRCEPIAVEEMCRNGGEGVFLLLDGWDELPKECRKKDSFFLDLIQGQVLPDATVLVTSRPHASEIIVTECRDCVFQYILVAGFTENNVQAFISSSVGDDSKLLEGLQTYVSSYPHIKSMMYNPLNAAIVVEVYRNSYEKESIIPETMTELYSSLIRSLLLRYLKEHPEEAWGKRIRQFSHLPPNVYQQFCEVSRVAYEGITNHQQVIFTDLPDDFNSLDLMQCVPDLYVDEGAVLSYNFLHLSIQEFLAAYHVSLQSAQKKIEFFRNHQEAQSNQMVLKFFAGLTNLEDISDDELLYQLSEDTRIDLATIHFLFETKPRIKMLNGFSKVMFYGLGYTSQFDSYVLGYIASLTTCSWKIVIECGSDRASVVAMLVKGTLDAKHENLYPTEALPVSLNIEGGGSCGWDCTDLSYFFKAHPSFLKRIVSLKLYDIGLDGHSCEVFSKHMSLVPHLEVLDLSRNDSIGYSQEYDYSPSSSSRSDCSSPLDTLSIDSSSSQLDSQLSSRSDYPTSAVKLIDALKTQNTVKLLNFTVTNIGEPECEALAQWLSSPTCSLHVLHIGYNNLSFQATQVIITSLCQNCTLNELDISWSHNISLELLPSLIQLPLLRLNLNQCDLGPEEMCVIARALCGNSKLEILELKDNTIKNEGAIALANTLMQNKTLKHIGLYKCEITEQGAQALQNSLEHNNTLLKLTLSSTSMKITDKRILYGIYVPPPNEYYYY